jgi:hypothetical protein
MSNQFASTETSRFFIHCGGTEFSQLQKNIPYTNLVCGVPNVISTLCQHATQRGKEVMRLKQNKNMQREYSFATSR